MIQKRLVMKICCIPTTKDLWSNYAIAVYNGYEAANQWIKDDVEKVLQVIIQFWLDGAYPCHSDSSSCTCTSAVVLLIPYQNFQILSQHSLSYW